MCHYKKLYKSLCMVAISAGVLVTDFAFAIQPIADIAQTPLELTPTVEPNVMILFDDSGSMDFEIMTADSLSSGLFFAPNPDGSDYGSTESGLQITHRSGCDLTAAAFGGYAYGVKSSANQYEPNASLGADKANCYVAAEQAWRFRCSGFNTLYYDPSVVYQPWPGVRSDGTPFPPADPVAAPLDPFDVNSPTVNIESPDLAATGLSNFRYYLCDRDEEGDFQLINEVVDAQGNIEVANEVIIDADSSEKQNFANWFTYYRSRHLRAKAVLGNFIVSQNNSRIGLAQLNTNATSSLEIAEMNVNLDEGEKLNLLNALYSLAPDEMTGSRFDSQFVQTAKYLACQNNNIFDNAQCPALPVQAGICRANHIIVASDGFLDGVSVLGAEGVGDADSAASSNEFDEGPFVDAANEVSNIKFRTFSDVTIDFYRQDLHNGNPQTLADGVEPTEADRIRFPEFETQPLEVDELLHQHIKTHALLLDVSLQQPESDLVTFPSNSDFNTQAPLPFAWFNPNESDIGLLQSLYHAAYSGRGEVLSATTSVNADPVSEVESLINDVAQTVGSTTPVAINTQSTGSDIIIYRTFFDSSSHSGDLTAQEIIVNADGSLSIETQPPNYVWSAAQELDNLVGVNGASYSQRHIITYSETSNDGIQFQFSDLDPTQQTQLNEPIPGSLMLGEDRLNYLRGLTEREGTGFNAGEFRIRPETDSTGGSIIHHAKLGTIANAAPVFVGLPTAVGRFSGAWPNIDGETYFDFQASQANRDSSVLVAANDGMLHVFNAENGVERFAYVPSMIFENLSSLTDPEYSHRFFIDSTPVVEDVYIRADGSTSQSWHTIVIGGLGAGGRGYYALDITDPDPLDNPEDQVLWEFGPEDDPDSYIDGSGNLVSDLGLSFSEPAIAMSNATDSGEQRWVAVFGNGYNNTGVDGPAVIYMLFIDRGIDGSWAETGDLVKIDLGEDGVSAPNGVGDVRAIDEDGNGTIDRLYAGDLLGNLHVVNINSANPNDWNAFSNRYVLFEARYSQTNQIQPITTRPSVVDNEGGAANDVIVIFATGSYFTNSDAMNTDTQSIYGVIDDFSGNQVNVSNLIEQTLTNSQFVDPDTGIATDVRTLSTNQALTSSQGWFIDFDAEPSSGTGIEFPGERAIRGFQLRSDILFVNTVIPQALNCGPSPGGFSLALDPQTGTSGENIIFDINNDSVFDNDDTINITGTEASIIAGIRFKSTPSDSVFVGDYRVTQLSDTDIDAVLTNTAQTNLVGRQAWREVEF